MKKTIFIVIALVAALAIDSAAQGSSGSSSSNKGKAIKPGSNRISNPIANVVGDAVPTGRVFWIQSGNNVGRNKGGYWDIPGGPTSYKNGMNIQSWNIDNGPDRKYRIEQIPGDRYYRIFVDNSNHYCVDLKSNHSKNGQNIHVWGKNGSDAQKFYFKKQNNGSYKIFHKSGRLICLAGRSSNNGSNIHLWDNHDGPWVEWNFIDTRTGRVVR
ncbi:MAG: RICIN domain-containing protein [Salinivirgaceae bacterium]